MKNTYSIHASMDGRDIAVVMDRRERMGRKFDGNEIGHELMEIALRFLLSYQGDFAWMHQMQARHAQYGRLLSSQAAGVLNSMVSEIEHELKHAVRQEKKGGKRKTVSIGFSTEKDE